MAVYEYTDDGVNPTCFLTESHIYGGKRLGIYNRNVDMEATYTPPSTETRILGNRSYELSNHLNNVLNVISDRLLTVDGNTDNFTDYYMADVISYCDYTPYGMQMENRNGNTTGFRFGYQGSEKDQEIKGEGNSYTTYFRQIDPRLGRWLSIDPKANASESPYVSMANNPIWFNDPLGDTVKYQSIGAEKLYNSYKLTVNNKIDEINNKIDKLNLRIEKREDKGKSTSNLESKVDNLVKQREPFETILCELETLEKSENIYRIRFGEEDFHPKTGTNKDAGGNFGYNTETKEYDVNIKKTTYDPVTGEQISWSNIQKIAHELTHAYQLENKQINFTKSGNSGYAYDITDEYEAFERQNLFSENPNQNVVNIKKFVNFYYPELYDQRPYEINVP